jgi:uroporphyrin-III C-methyltransferase
MSEIEVKQPDPAPAHGAWRFPRVTPAFVLAAVALAIVLWQWIDARNELSNVRQEIARRLSDADTFNRDSRTVANQSRDSQRDFEVRLGMLEARVLEAQNQRLALESLYQELQKGRDERVLAEVEQLLLIAGQQLQLAGNVRAALIALESADSRLGRADRPQFTALRKVINRDMERLKKTPFVDVVGTALKLDQLAAGVDALPLAMEQRLAAVADDSGKEKSGRMVAILKEYWNDLKSLVRVRNMAESAPPLVAPEQAYFLHESLKLRFFGARLALLAHDDASYKVDLKAAAAWMRQYFDAKNKNVAAALSQLKVLAETDVNVDMPDISASLDAVRNYKLVRERVLR